jgi:electron transfer flavoprotein-quinone oxidoreductase
MAGGFVYTNQDTVSLGILVQLRSLFGRNLASHDMIEQFRAHPAIAARIRGAELVEYGAKLISSGWASRPAAFHGEGWMVAGDTAGFVFSNGLVIQGMNYAIRSGIEAAETALAARAANDPSAARLAEYDRRLESTGVLPDFRNYARLDHLKWNPEVYSAYPRFATELLHEIMTETGQPKQPVRQMLRRTQKKARVRTTSMVRDGVRMLRDL